MRKGFLFTVAVAAMLFAVAGHAAPSAEPRNLSLLKDEIRAYIDSGRYMEGIAAVAKEAGDWLEKRAKQGGGRLAVVFDIDETMLSNLPVIRGYNFGYERGVWDAWVARGEAPVIEPVREVYRTARRLGIEVIFITGRREGDRPGTEKNLRAAGVGEYAGLYFKPDADKGTTARFKTAIRQQLTKEGFVIIANVGDQDSDLDGGLAERTFKLPDPFYLTY